MANKGDTVPILLNYTIDGTPIEEMALDEIEFSLADLSYRLTEGQIAIDPASGKYRLMLSQETTLALDNVTDFQVRFKKGTDVTSTGINLIVLGDSKSKEVL